jgi:hypothetical protein
MKNDKARLAAARVLKSCLLLGALAFALADCAGENQSTGKGDEASGGVAGVAGVAGDALNPNHWHLTVQRGEPTTDDQYDSTARVCYNNDASSLHESIVYAGASAVGIQWNFRGRLDQLVPIVADETTTNYASASIVVPGSTIVENEAGMLAIGSWVCSGPSEQDGGAPKSSVGTFSLNVDSAVAQPAADGKACQNDGNATEYFIHGSLHAVCPGAETVQVATVDATF